MDDYLLILGLGNSTPPSPPIFLQTPPPLAQLASSSAPQDPPQLPTAWTAQPHTVAPAQATSSFYPAPAQPYPQYPPPNSNVLPDTAAPSYHPPPTTEARLQQMESVIRNLATQNSALQDSSYALQQRFYSLEESFLALNSAFIQEVFRDLSNWLRTWKSALYRGRVTFELVEYPKIPIDDQPRLDKVCGEVLAKLNDNTDLAAEQTPLPKPDDEGKPALEVVVQLRFNAICYLFVQYLNDSLKTELKELAKTFVYIGERDGQANDDIPKWTHSEELSEYPGGIICLVDIGTDLRELARNWHHSCAIVVELKRDYSLKKQDPSAEEVLSGVGMRCKEAFVQEMRHARARSELAGCEETHALITDLQTDAKHIIFRHQDISHTPTAPPKDPGYKEFAFHVELSYKQSSPSKPVVSPKKSKAGRNSQLDPNFLPKGKRQTEQPVDYYQAPPVSSDYLPISTATTTVQPAAMSSTTSLFPTASTSSSSSLPQLPLESPQPSFLPLSAQGQAAQPPSTPSLTTLERRMFSSLTESIFLQLLKEIQKKKPDEGKAEKKKPDGDANDDGDGDDEDGNDDGNDEGGNDPTPKPALFQLPFNQAGTKQPGTKQQHSHQLPSYHHELVSAQTLQELHSLGTNLNRTCTAAEFLSGDDFDRAQEAAYALSGPTTCGIGSLAPVGTMGPPYGFSSSSSSASLGSSAASSSSAVSSRALPSATHSLSSYSSTSDTTVLANSGYESGSSGNMEEPDTKEWSPSKAKKAPLPTTTTTDTHGTVENDKTSACSAPFSWIALCDHDVVSDEALSHQPPPNMPDSPLFVAPSSPSACHNGEDNGLLGFTLQNVLRTALKGGVGAHPPRTVVPLVERIWSLEMAALAPLHFRGLVHAMFDLSSVVFNGENFTLTKFDDVAPVFSLPLKAPLGADIDSTNTSLYNWLDRRFGGLSAKHQAANKDSENTYTATPRQLLLSELSTHIPNYSHRMLLGKNPTWRDDIEAAFLSTLKELIGDASWLDHFGSILPWQHAPHYRAALVFYALPVELHAWASPICEFLGY